MTETTGWQGYVLFTDQGMEQLQIEKGGFVEQTERYEHLGDVGTFVMDMHVRYAALKATGKYS